MIRHEQFHDTEYLVTLVATVLSGMTLRPPSPLRYLVTLVATVPAELEGGWLKTYSSELGADVVDYGGGATGSPAVPGSSRLLHREGDSALYTVTVLRGQFQAGYVDDDDKFQSGSFVDFVEAYKAACKERKVRRAASEREKRARSSLSSRTFFPSL